MITLDPVTQRALDNPCAHGMPRNQFCHQCWRGRCERADADAENSYVAELLEENEQRQRETVLAQGMLCHALEKNRWLRTELEKIATQSNDPDNAAKIAREALRHGL